MKIKSIILFVLEKALGIGLIAFGVYTVGCHFGKTLPFGVKVSDVLMSIWAYTGWLIGIIIICAGIYLTFRQYIDILIHCIEEDRNP